MRSCPHTSVAALAIVAALALTGCTTPAAPAAPPESPSASPLFASDDEALAAAKDAYAKYLAVADQILVDGGKKPERLKPLVEDSVYTDQLAGFKTFEENGWRSSGGTLLSSFSLQSYEPTDLDAIVIAYACNDVSKVDVVDSSGASVVAADRPPAAAFQVTFAANSAPPLLIADEIPWDGEGVC